MQALYAVFYATVKIYVHPGNDVLTVASSLDVLAQALDAR